MALTPSDKELLAGTINTLMGQVPFFLRGALNAASLAGFLKAVPDSFRSYRLQEILDALDELNRENRIQ